MSKPGFMVYHKDFKALDKLNDASFHRVFRAACEYSESGTVSFELNDTEEIIFEMLKTRLDDDDARYHRRVDAGRKGGLAKSSNAKQSLANPSNGYQTLAKSSISTNTNSNTKPNTNSNPIPNTGYSSNTYAREDGEEEFPPSVGEVEQYIREKGLNVDAEDFIRRCEAADWKDGQGRPIMNWRIYLTGYALKAMQPQGGRAARMGGIDPRLAALEAMKGGKG